MTSEQAGPGESLQKLLMPWLVRGVLEQGYTALGGPVVRAVDVEALRRPVDLVAAYGLLGAGGPFGAAPEQVGVLRFAMDPLMALTRPTSRGPRPWPTYDSGFLLGDVPVPVWTLERTRAPYGAQLVLLDASGEEQVKAVFMGPASGWRGAAGYYPPVHLVGPRVEWQGLDLPGGLSPDGGQVELVHVGAEPPRDGFTEVRPDVWRLVLPVSQVQRVFDLTLSCRWRGVPCRILQHTADASLLLLGTDDPQDVQALGGQEVEPGVFEVTAPSAELAEISAVTRDLR